MATQTAKRNSATHEDVTVAEAIEQIKDASAGVYQAVGALGEAGKASAKQTVDQGKASALEYKEKAEVAARDNPVITLGVAFAAGWLVSRLLAPGKGH